jgi:hypothetical protein
MGEKGREGEKEGRGEEEGKVEEIPLEAPPLPLIDGTEYSVEADFLKELIRLYPAVDVIQEFRLMRGWLLGNPTKKKTRRGIRRFITSWLSRSQQGYRGKPQALGYHRTHEGRDWVEIEEVKE